MPVLRPPTRDLGPVALDRLHIRYKIPRGIALIVNGAAVTENQYPSQRDLENATAFYLGGHVYEITDAEATVLTAAGYGAFITGGPLTPPDPDPEVNSYPGTFYPGQVFPGMV